MQENLEHFFIIFENKFQTRYQNNFIQNRLSKHFRPFKNPSRFRFPWTSLWVKSFVREIVRNAGEDSTNLQLDTTKQERKGGVRWPRGYTLEVNQLIGGNFRGKSGNLTLSCVCSAESRRETPPPPRLPTVETKIPLAWVRGRERNKEEEEEEGCGWWGWIEESGGGGRTTIAVDIRASFGGRRRRKTAGIVAVDDDSSGANELRPGKNNKSGNLVSESPVELS